MLEHFCEILVAELPHFFLRLCVLNVRNWVFNVVVKRDRGDFFSPLPVFLASEAGVVGILDTVTFRKDPFTNIIKVGYFCGEPRY